MQHMGRRLTREEYVRELAKYAPDWELAGCYATKNSTDSYFLGEKADPQEGGLRVASYWHPDSGTNLPVTLNAGCQCATRLT